MKVIETSTINAGISTANINSESKKNSPVVTEEVKGTQRKGMLPAGGPLPKLQKNSIKEQAAFKEKLGAILNEVKITAEKAGFDPYVKNVLLLYVAFAQNQMDQNDKLEAGWMDQQHVQNLLLEDSAKEQKNIANQSTQSRHANTGMLILFGLIAIVSIALLFTGVGSALGAGLLVAEEGAIATAAAATSGYAFAGAGAVVGAGVTAGFTAPAMNNPEAPGLGPVTQEGPDEAKLMQINILNSFYNLLAQRANQNIQTGTQLNIVNPSSSNTQQGQQAAQVIQEWGEMSRFQVAR